MTAKERLDQNLEDVDEIIAAHVALTGGGKGKPEDGKGAALTRAGIVLLAAAMEAFVEDLFAEALPARYPELDEPQRKKLCAATIDRLNNADYQKTCLLFFNLGLPWILDHIRWQKFSNKAFKKSLETLIQRRGSIAHGKRPHVQLKQLRDWKRMVSRYAEKLQGLVAE